MIENHTQINIYYIYTLNCILKIIETFFYLYTCILQKLTSNFIYVHVS